MPTLQPTSQGKLALRVVEKVDKSSTSHNIARHVMFQVAGKIASCNSTLTHTLDQFYVVQPFGSVYNTQMNATEQYFPAVKCVFHTQRDNFFIRSICTCAIHQFSSTTYLLLTLPMWSILLHFLGIVYIEF